MTQRTQKLSVLLLVLAIAAPCLAQYCAGDIYYDLGDTISDGPNDYRSLQYCKFLVNPPTEAPTPMIFSFSELAFDKQNDAIKVSIGDTGVSYPYTDDGSIPIVFPFNLCTNNDSALPILEISTSQEGHYAGFVATVTENTPWDPSQCDNPMVGDRFKTIGAPEPREGGGVGFVFAIIGGFCCCSFSIFGCIIACANRANAGPTPAPAAPVALKQKAPVAPVSSQPAANNGNNVVEDAGGMGAYPVILSNSAQKPFSHPGQAYNPAPPPFQVEAPPAYPVSQSGNYQPEQPGQYQGGPQSGHYGQPGQYVQPGQYGQPGLGQYGQPGPAQYGQPGPAQYQSGDYQPTPPGQYQPTPPGQYQPMPPGQYQPAHSTAQHGNGPGYGAPTQHSVPSMAGAMDQGFILNGYPGGVGMGQAAPPPADSPAPNSPAPNSVGYPAGVGVGVGQAAPPPADSATPQEGNGNSPDYGHSF